MTLLICVECNCKNNYTHRGEDVGPGGVRSQVLPRPALSADLRASLEPPRGGHLTFTSSPALLSCQSRHVLVHREVQID